MVPKPSQSNSERISVAVRIRPLSQQEINNGAVCSWEARDSKTLWYENKNPVYTYDSVFSQEADTEYVYNDFVSTLLSSAMSGVNATLFAYGQTGSGKTYTISGIMRQAARQVFKTIDQNSDKEFIIKLSAVEIYNELVRDLLTGKEGLEVMENGQGEIRLPNLQEEGIRSLHQLTKCLELIECRREVRGTTQNERSSRSHQIVRLHIESQARHYEGEINIKEVNVSTFTFVDLAGSERSSSNTDEKRRQEGTYINRSLLTLGRVITELATVKGSHNRIPYRDSRLTRILQPSLQGNSRMALICTINPNKSDVENSKSALQFANTATKVTMKPQVNKVIDVNSQLKQYESHIKALKQKLHEREQKTGVLAMRAALDVAQREAQTNSDEVYRLKKQIDGLQKLFLRGRQGVGKGGRRASWGTSNNDKNENRRHSFSESQLSDYSGVKPCCLTWPPQLEVPESNCRRVGSECSSPSYSMHDGQLVEFLIRPRVRQKCLRLEETMKNEGIRCDLQDEVANIAAAAVDEALSSLSQWIEGDRAISENSFSASNTHERPPALLLTPTSILQAQEQESCIPSKLSDQQLIQKVAERVEKEYTRSLQAKWHKIKSNLNQNAEKMKQAYQQAKDEKEKLRGLNTILMKEVLTLKEEKDQGDLKTANLEYQLQCVQTNFKGLLSKGGIPSLNIPGANNNHTKPNYSNHQDVLEEIIQLWQDLNISLTHRSHFYLKFRYKPIYYLEAECGSLRELKETEWPGRALDRPDITIKREQRARRLEQERNWLVQQMKFQLNKQQREQLFKSFGIGWQQKHRKIKMVQQLWEPVFLKNDQWVEKHARVVIQLNGDQEDSCESVYLLGLSTKQQEHWKRPRRKSMIPIGFTALGKAIGSVVTPRTAI